MSIARKYGLSFSWRLYMLLSLLAGTSSLSEVSATIVSDGISFEQIMEIPLRKCQVVLFSHDVKYSPRRPTRNVALVELVREKLQDLQIPTQYWVKRPSDHVTQELLTKSLNSNAKLGCATFLLFLETREMREHKGFATLQPLPWVTYTLRPKQAEHDFTILGFENTPEQVRIEWTMRPDVREELPIVFPENLLFLRMSTLSKSGKEGMTMSVTEIGSLRIFCREGKRLCIHWHDLMDSDGGNWWKNPEEFYRKLALQSSYRSNHAYNFNGAKVVTTARSVVPPKYWNAIRKLGFQEALFPSLNPGQNYRSYGTVIGWIIHATWRNLQVVEATYNASMAHYEEQMKHKYLHNGKSIWPEYTPGIVALQQIPSHQRLLALDFFHVNVFCVDSLEHHIDFLSIFNPMDLWTWISFLVGSLVMSAAFWGLTKSPIFSLVAIFFAQGDAEEGSRFYFLIVIWSLLGFLLTSGYSSMIASIFVAPPQVSHPLDLSSLYLQGYKLAISHYQSASRDYGTKNCLSDHKFGNQHVATLNEHLKGLDRDAVVIRTNSLKANYHDQFVGVGKVCGIASENRVKLYTQLYSLAYSEKIFFSCKKTLACTQRSYALGRPGAELLRGGMQLMYATGIFQFWDTVGDQIVRVEVSTVLFETIARRHPHYRFAYFFHIIQDQDFYIFSVRTAQGQMIFYFGLICAALALSTLFLEMSLARLNIVWDGRQKPLGSEQTECDVHI